ncbi:MotA/TolQ/ExbB proton channel family protein [Roseiarcaceae bacterium H3SJ34-1]|uniref:MotA/TolQ/ExbB proton channel family protein n=1 Tax=Terripilifer ovatus TaxID=3032367 RepID=UPI003AB91F9C|nr:MotA/TolQ/ExbB proton channel family protein [Roseiarcaceae bacterium H3SJ34-1]
MDGLSISPVALFIQAGLVGKSVIILLGLASVWCWVLIFEGLFSVSRLNRAVRGARGGQDNELIAPIARSGLEAATVSIAGEGPTDIRQRITEAMNRAGRELLMRAEGGLPNLAIISSVSPFVGLFGTVWGIMVSFVGIAASKDTSLAVVAPGIAEALAATAFGLAAAIPASIGYNRIGAAFARSGQLLSNLIEERAVKICADGKIFTDRKTHEPVESA